jgi:hypothetical protein
VNPDTEAVGNAGDPALCAEPALMDLAVACAALSDLPGSERLRRVFSDATGILGRVFPVRAMTAAGFRELELLDVRSGLAAIEVLPDLSHWRRVGDPIAGDVRLTQWKSVSSTHRVRSRVVSDWVTLAVVPAPAPSGEIQLEGEGIRINLPLDRAWRQIPQLALAWRRRLASRLATHESLSPAEIVLPLAGPLWAVLAEPIT